MTAVALGGTPLVALAQGATMQANVEVGVKASTSKPGMLKTIREEAKDKIQDVRASMTNSSTTRDERKENLREMAKIRIEAKFKRMFLRLQATVDRERMIMAKMNTRITKVKTAGGTTTASEKFTAEAKVHLDEAQTALNLLKATAVSDFELKAQAEATTTNASLTGETMKKMKALTAEIEKHLREAHKALTNSLRSLRGMSTTNASTTTQVNASTTSN